MEQIMKLFVEATMETFTTMVGLTPDAGEIEDVGHIITPSEICANISLSGDNAQGATTITFAREVAIKVVEGFMGEGMADSDEDLYDALGEIVNIIGGAAKAKLSEMQLKLSLPSVTGGNNYFLSLPKDLPIKKVKFTLEDLGEMNLIVYMKHT